MLKIHTGQFSSFQNGVTSWQKLLTEHAFLPAMFAPEYSSTFIDIDLMLPMRSKARQLGVRVINKVHIVDLLTQDNRVTEQPVLILLTAISLL
jgi:hypothetical protein